MEEEVPGNVGSPANGQERGPSPGAEDGRTAKERGADELQAEVGRWSPMLQAEHNVVDGGYAEPYTVHEPLAAPRKPSTSTSPIAPRTPMRTAISMTSFPPRSTASRLNCVATPVR